MSVTAANTAISTAAATQANIAAHQAHVERCTIELAAYSPKTATVAQMQSYAGCVNFMHPSTESASAMKFVVGVLLLAMIIGAIFGAVRAPYDHGFEAVHGAICGLGIAFFGGLLIVAVAFVFS